jgi:hypothetical protein
LIVPLITCKQLLNLGDFKIGDSIVPLNILTAVVSNLAAILKAIDKILVSDQVSQAFRLKVGWSTVEEGLVLEAVDLQQFV